MRALLWHDLHEFERKLAIELSRISTQACPELPPSWGGPYKGWLICPRAHAVAHNFRIPRFSAELMDRLISEGWGFYDQLGRAYHGDDLVLAIGDIR